MHTTPLTRFADWLELPHSVQGSVTGVAVDSRQVVPGDLFFALPGERCDGHEYVVSAIRQGAVAAVVERGRTWPQGLPILEVSDTLVALQQASQGYLRTCFSGRIAAVTASVGKTTMKGFLVELLRERYRTWAPRGNYNSQIGLPLSLFTLEGEEEWLVLEMGLSAPGHIQRLVSLYPPDLALLGRVSLAHSAFFTDLNAIARAKGEIFSSPCTQFGLLCADLPNLDEIMQLGTCSKATFSVTSPSADYRFQLQSRRVRIFQDSEVWLDVPWELPGRHNQFNFCAAALAAKEAGVSAEEIVRASKRLALPPMRFEQMERDGVLWIHDAYNACQASMEAALESLPTVPGRRIAVLGEMGELGKFAWECHEAVGQCALRHVDRLLCIGEGCLPMVKSWVAEGREATHCKAIEEMIALLEVEVKKGDVVLVKGSRSNRLERVLEHFVP